MPGMDGTGPFGTGPMGRGLGPCGGGQPRFSRGYRTWRGGGFGWRNVQTDLPSEKEALEIRKNWLEKQLSVINQYLQELTANKEAK